MKKLDLQNKGIEELKRDLKEAQKAHFDLRVENELRKLKNVMSINFKRKEVAALKTKIREKELADAR